MCLNNRFKTNEKYLIYIPSSASIYNFKNENVAIDYAKNNSYERVNVVTIRNLSNLFEKKTKDITIKNKFRFYSLKTDLKKISKEKVIHGYFDNHHFNYLGHKTIAASISKNIF